MNEGLFKVCSKCGSTWPARLSFLNDSGLTLVGYQVNFEDLKAGLFLFNHACGTTLSVAAEEFQDFYDGPMFVERLDGTSECSGYCIHESDLHPCPASCECAYVREIIQVILRWPKQGNTDRHP